MSLICAQRNELEGYIKAGDNRRIVRCLEEISLKAEAVDGERLLLGVLLLLPPFSDYDAASEVFEGLLGGARSLEAAVWNAYGYVFLQPDGNRLFQKTLEHNSNSSVACHMRGLVARADGDVDESISRNRESRRIELFPFNILSALDDDAGLGLGDIDYLKKVFVDLLVSKSAESDPFVRTADGMLRREWDNLISGVRVTSQYWNFLANTRGFG